MAVCHAIHACFENEAEREHSVYSIYFITAVERMMSTLTTYPEVNQQWNGMKEIIESGEKRIDKRPPVDEKQYKPMSVCNKKLHTTFAYESQSISTFEIKLKL